MTPRRPRARWANHSRLICSSLLPHALHNLSARAASKSNQVCMTLSERLSLRARLDSQLHPPQLENLDVGENGEGHLSG